MQYLLHYSFVWLLISSKTLFNKIEITTIPIVGKIMLE